MILALLLLASAQDQDAKSKAAQSADSFSLDLAAPAEPTSASPPESDTPAPRPAAKPARSKTRAKSSPPPLAVDPTALDSPSVATGDVALTLDTPIRELIADPRGRAVLDADMDGLSTDANLAKFEDKSLREFQPLTGGQLSDALLAKVGRDLADPSAILAAAEKKRKREAEVGR